MIEEQVMYLIRSALRGSVFVASAVGFAAVFYWWWRDFVDAVHGREWRDDLRGDDG